MGEFVRFVLAGLVNTAVGFGVYLALAPALGPQVAFATGYAFGIVVAFAINSRFVFRASMTLRKAVVYPLVYVALYLVGAIVLGVATGVFEIDHRWAALAALLASVPVSFVLNRLVLAESPSRDP